MNVPTLQLSLRLAARTTLSAAIGMALVILMVGALFPAVGGSIGKLDLPEGVADLLGGADYGSLTGWMRSEIGAVYGPLVVAATAITAAAGSTAGEEQDGILGLVLAHPVDRSRLIVAKAATASASAPITRPKNARWTTSAVMSPRPIPPPATATPAISPSQVPKATTRTATATAAAFATISRERSTG